jgi:hypothetical protein
MKRSLTASTGAFYLIYSMTSSLRRANEGKKAHVQNTPKGFVHVRPREHLD